MSARIANISELSGVGVLGDRTRADSSLGFLKYNLIYGFNGSGKSTLSRLFASLQGGSSDPMLPENCSFEFEMETKSYLKAPGNLKGIEKHILVFNTDFVDRNLQWNNSAANPIFYIGREQAEAAADLARKENQLTEIIRESAEAVKLQQAAEKALSTFKRGRAKLVSEQGRFVGRSYEAGQLEQDFADLSSECDAPMSQEALDVARSICARESIDRVSALVEEAELKADILAEIINLSNETPGTIVLEGLQRHPDMLLWVKKGFEYHQGNGLETCLFCDNPITPERTEALEQIFNDHLDQFLQRLRFCREQVVVITQSLLALQSRIPAPSLLLGEFSFDYEQAQTRLVEEIETAKSLLTGAGDILQEKSEYPTRKINVQAFQVIVSQYNITNLDDAIARINEIIRKHNGKASTFTQYQSESRLSIRKHNVAEARAEYDGLVKNVEDAKVSASESGAKIAQLKAEIALLKSVIREHSKAAEIVNKLIASYLGHHELTIRPTTEGYEIQRHGRRLIGPPSEGEKTAIALCYFISMLQSDGRKLEDTILVIDDPISSLDSKALNYACTLVKSRVEQSAQVFILTHNLPCMNEFKKYWKQRAKPDDASKQPTARFFFLNVGLPRNCATRKSTFSEMSKLLREYDFEYHFLFKHVVDFESQGIDYEYAYMMPHLLRRVLEVFLTFKCPGSAGLASKVDQLCSDYSLETVRMKALDRLTQVESHSDNLDDLVGFSSMTLEESYEAAKALIEMMHTADPKHTDHMLRLCR
jgi:wobble nucleotide-excising tRNase